MRTHPCILLLIAAIVIASGTPAWAQTPQETAASWNQKAVEAYQAKDYAKALEYERQAMEQAPDNVLYATSMAQIYRTMERFVEGQQLLEAKLKAFTREEDRNQLRIALADMHFFFAKSLNNRYDYDQAILHYQAAFEIDRLLRRKDAAIDLNNLGLAYDNLSQYQKAIGYYEQALAIRREVKDRNDEAVTLNNLMWVWKEIRNRGLAIFYGKQSVNAYQAIRADIKGLDKDIQKGFLEANRDTYRTLADLLIQDGRLPEAQQVLGLLKQEEYFEFVRRDQNEAGPSGHADYTPREAEWDKRYREISDRVTAIGLEFSALYAKKNRKPAEEARLATLDKDRVAASHEFQKFLDALAAEFAKNTGVANRLDTLRDVEAITTTLRKLQNHSVALYTLVGEKTISLLLVTPDTQVARTYPIGAADLNTRVLAFREALQNPRLDPRPLAKELYDILVGPVEKDLAGAQAQTLMWSLDGTLRTLPDAALHDDKQYLIERFKNAPFPPASLNRLEHDVDAQWTALGLGVSRAYPGFNPLTAVPEELRGIIREQGGAGILPGTVMLDTDFTLPAMKSALGHGYKIVHIASHFAFRPGNETDSFLLLGDGSHLSLAEIKQMPSYLFEGVNLLTLSACDTATGGKDADGREVEGFGVLAQRKGADAVIASLWPVADKSTELLMRAFYQIRQFHPGMPKIEALREAQLTLLGRSETAPDAGANAPRTRRVSSSGTVSGRLPAFTPDPNAPYAHPYYWAPFILIGNWR